MGAFNQISNVDVKKIGSIVYKYNYVNVNVNVFVLVCKCDCKKTCNFVHT